MATPRPVKGKKGSSAPPKASEQKKKKKEKKKLPKKMVKRSEKVVKAALKAQRPAAPGASPTDERGGIRRILLEMKGKLVADISENFIPQELKASSEIGDLVDQAGDERDRELSLLLTDRDKEKLAAINDALEKLEEGSYGICEECGEKIGPGRIKVMPLARFCVNCQSGLEREMTMQRRAEEDLKYRGLAYAAGGEEEEEG